MRIALLIAAALLLTGLCAGSAHATRELVRNPLLSQGKDGKPLHWKPEGYRMEPTVTVFGWNVDDSKIGVIEIENKVANDARYVQSVPVSPDTWYHVSGWGRAENVGATSMGLYLSVLGTFHNSRDLRGTLGWQPLSFWVRTGGLETKLKISCRLGGYSSLNTGKGWCTGISVMAAGSPEPSRYVYGSTAAQQLSGGPFGIQAIAVLLVLGALLLIWRYVLPPSKQIPE
ncbi:MAG: hypothetical protein P8R42_25590 [Candidatus Binatia bacterium]|nr:hypothetical protein [Candidatus Binatia bacterium]